MALTLRKRHTAACRRKNGLAEYYRRSACPFWAVGGLRVDGFIRASTKESKLELAELTKRQWEAAGTTTVVLEPAPAPVEATPVSIEHADAEFETAYIRAKHVKDATARKYRTMLKQLKEFAAERGVRFVKEIGLAELQAFQASWNMGALAAGKRVEHVRTFWEFCCEREFIATNPAKKLRSRRRRSHRTSRSPMPRWIGSS